MSFYAWVVVFAITIAALAIIGAFLMLISRDPDGRVMRIADAAFQVAVASTFVLVFMATLARTLAR